MLAGSWLQMFAIVCTAIAVAGCTTPAEEMPRQPPFGPPPDVSDPRFGVFVPERVDAVLGEHIVIPVELAGDFRPADVGLARLDDNRRVPTDLIWLRGPEPTGDPLVRTWLPRTGQFSVVRPGESGAGVGPGSWMIVIDPPINAVGQGVWLAGRRVQVNWLPDPREAANRTPSEAWASPLPAGVRRSSALQRTLDPIRVMPTRRWRARLVSGELSPGSERPVVDSDGAFRRDAADGRTNASFGDEALDAVASATEARWLIGLARLYEADPDLSLEVRRRLCSVVDFGDGAIAPVWSTDAAGVEQLLDDLTDQTLAVRERARRAELWLSDQPAGVAWILSDAGRSFSAGQPLTTVALLNTTWDAALASLESWSAGEPAVLEPVAPLSVRAEEIVSRPAGAKRAALVATIGGEEFQLLAGAADAVARPPGLRIEALLHNITLEELLSQRRTIARADRTGALLYLDHRGRWVLYAECNTDGRTPGDEDTLIVTLGAVGSRIEAEVVASSEGIVGLRDQGIAGSLSQPVEAEVARYEGGWSLRLTVPERFVEDGRAFRFGLQRRTDRGVRSAWPRAMLPWQQSVPRAAVDLARWND
ncbi:MAG: hypothetical protein AAFN41_07155 [Planctomycetota bacterium]